jgi:hypothetical protein
MRKEAPPPDLLDPVKLQEYEPERLSKIQLRQVIEADQRGQLRPGQLPFHVELRRMRALDSPFFLATEVLDPWYKTHLRPVSYFKELLDDVLKNWVLGKKIIWEGQEYDPDGYTGLCLLASRSTIKSTMLRILCLWIAVHRKLVMREDSRIMYVHHVIEKAVEHSEAIRNVAREHKLWRETFPEFAVNPSREWDRQGKWRWPNFRTYMATEWSFMGYGETSSKTGGHYTDRLIDDWVDDDCPETPTGLDQQYDRFRKMDNLRDRSRKWNPWISFGTTHHFQDTYMRLERHGGWLVLRKPAHTGSPKRIFDLCGIPDRTPEGRRRIKLGLKKLREDPPGELHFPDLLPWEECYRTARATGPHIYNCQILLNPVPEGEERFDHAALAEAWTAELPEPSEMWLYVRVDPAISARKDASDTAIVLGGVKWDSARYLLDGWVGKERKPTEIVRKTYRLASAWIEKGYRVQNIGFEAVAYQEALAEMARNGVPAREAVASGEKIEILKPPCPVRSIQRSAELRKQERILELDGPITRREFKIWTKCPEQVGHAAMQQLQHFPHDKMDVLDAIHDLWEGTSAPPPQKIEVVPQLHPELLKLIRKGETATKPTVRGTHTTVKLQSWG